VPGTSARKGDPTRRPTLREATTLPPGRASNTPPVCVLGVEAPPVPTRRSSAPGGCPTALAGMGRSASSTTTPSIPPRSAPRCSPPLLLPHSERTLGEIAGLVGDRVQRATVAFHLRKLLRVTGSAVALQNPDRAGLRRRHPRPAHRLRPTTPPRDRGRADRPHTWASFRQEGRRPDRRPAPASASARCYLYELLTGNNLHLAPSPYRNGERLRADRLPRLRRQPAAQARRRPPHHAERLLADAGTPAKPLQLAAADQLGHRHRLPGAEPTSPTRNQSTRPCGAGGHHKLKWPASLGISTEHLRYVVRQHPRPRPAYPTRRVLVARCRRTGPGDFPGPNAISLDPVWLHREYVTCGAACPTSPPSSAAASPTSRSSPTSTTSRCDGAPVPRGSPTSTPWCPPLAGPRTTSFRARRTRCPFCASPASSSSPNIPSLTQAARALGAHQCTLTNQLQQLERAAAVLLLHPPPTPPTCRPLTLSQQLHRQALDHLQATST